MIAYERGKPSGDGVSLTGRLIACRRADGRRRVLAQGWLGDLWFGRPARAVAVRGATVGFARVVDTELPSPATYLSIEVRSLTTARRNRTIANRQQTAPKVGSLDVTPRGSVAWIECVGNDPEDNADPRPYCIAPGLSINRVVASAFNGEPAELARAPDIDPLSLRIRDGVITWKEGGARRSAAFPGR